MTMLVLFGPKLNLPVAGIRPPSMYTSMSRGHAGAICLQL